MMMTCCCCCCFRTPQDKQHFFTRVWIHRVCHIHYNSPFQLYLAQPVALLALFITCSSDPTSHVKALKETSCGSRAGFFTDYHIAMCTPPRSVDICGVVPLCAFVEVELPLLMPPTVTSPGLSMIKSRLHHVASTRSEFDTVGRGSACSLYK